MGVIKRIKAEGFRSIEECDVELGPLTVLVGPNAAGKSNFMDIFRFASDALTSSVSVAVKQRGGLRTVVYYPTGSGKSAQFAKCSFDLEFQSGSENEKVKANYSFSFGPGRGGKVEVLSEEFQGEGAWRDYGFTRDQNHRVYGQGFTSDNVSPIPSESLALSHLSTLAPFSAAFHQLSLARFYDLKPQVLRTIDDSEPSVRPDVLGPTGEHFGHVLGLVSSRDPDSKATIDAYLSAMIQNAQRIEQRSELDGTVSTVEGIFSSDSDGKEESRIQRWGLSEGTLRLGGILTALLQPAVFDGSISFIGIEEPEKALHPPRLGALYEVLVAASHNTQVMVTTQSPDLLDSKEARPEHILAVDNANSRTIIGPLDETSRDLLVNKKYSLTELVRLGMLSPAG